MFTYTGTSNRSDTYPGRYMSKLTDDILSGGVESNTQNQMLNLNLYDQLRAGSRWFDLSVATVHQVVNCCGNYDF